MKLTVGTVPVRVPITARQRPLIQNLGPGVIYFDNAQTVSADASIKMDVGVVYEFPADLGEGVGALWVVADQAGCDLRYTQVG